MNFPFFNHLIPIPLDPIFKLAALFATDPRDHKIDLSIGLYRDRRLSTSILNSVKRAEEMLLSSEVTKEYLPIEGNATFIHQVGKLVFGEEEWLQEQERTCGIQTPGSTGALAVGGRMLIEEGGKNAVVSQPTWPNHPHIFTHCGMKVGFYPYYDMDTASLSFDKSYKFFETLSEGTIVVLQPCCHNPTGMNWQRHEWELCLSLFQSKKLFPFFDFAYQGFGVNLERDAEVIRLWARSGIEMMVVCSQAKNFGLYSERPGALFVLTRSQKVKIAILSKLQAIGRALYSSPPSHGAAIVAQILSTPSLREIWQRELEKMSFRMRQLRKELFQKLDLKRWKQKNLPSLKEGEGMFWLSGLQSEEVERLRGEFAIYITDKGRINIAGLSSENIPRVIEALMVVVS